MFNTKFLKAAGARAFRTFCQSLSSMIVVGMSFSEVDWINVLSVSGVAALISFLMSCTAGIPECKEGDFE